ncbi:MAG: acyltransferase [Saprospiraceae bacterium]|nr:acyltransferase [Saprospiraceae bacterium]
MRPPTERLSYLDAVRGLAAIFVVISHVIASHWHWMDEAKLALMVFNGNDAVCLFFVLSGLVLSHKVLRDGTPITANYYQRFALERMFRLYPAFLLMIFIYYVYLHHAAGFGNLWRETLLHNPHFFWEEAMLVRGHHDHFFPGWTLGVEVAMSLLVPFLILIARQGSRLLVFFLAASLFAGWFYVSQFIVHFGLGILLAKHFDQIQRPAQPEKWWFRHRLPLLLAVVLGYMVVHYYLTYDLPKALNDLLYSILQLNDYTLAGFIAAAIIAYVISSPGLRNFFSMPFFNFLGKISYGVYLSHWLFTTYTMANFEALKSQFAGGDELVFFFQFLAATLLLSILSGLALYHFVEMPFIKLGKKLAAKMAN